MLRTLVRQIGVVPAAEEVQLIPLALAVANHNNPVFRHVLCEILAKTILSESRRTQFDICPARYIFAQQSAVLVRIPSLSLHIPPKFTFNEHQSVSRKERREMDRGSALIPPALFALIFLALSPSATLKCVRSALHLHYCSSSCT